MSYESQLVLRSHPSDAAPSRFWAWFTLCSLAGILIMLPQGLLVMPAIMLTCIAHAILDRQPDSQRTLKPGVAALVLAGLVLTGAITADILYRQRAPASIVPVWGRALLGAACFLYLAVEMRRFFLRKRRAAAA